MKLRSLLIGATVVALFLGAQGVWAENLVINGSTTVLPIAQKVSEAYMKENPGVRISISGGGSGNGIKAIIDGTTDVGMSSRFIKESEVKLAVERGAYPVPFAVAYDCIVPVVHPSNSVSNITLEQLKAIYEGKLTNWKDLGGPDREVVVISRDTSSGTYEVWNKKVLQGARVFPRALLQASNGAVVQAVSRNQNAIGYVGLGYIDATLKALKVGGVAGSIETTLNGTFPISRPLFMFTSGWPEGQTAAFLNYMIHPAKGQKLASEIGFVPLF